MFVFMHRVYHGEFRHSAMGLGCVRSVPSSWVARACLLGAGTAQKGEEAVCETIVEACLQRNESRDRKHGSESLALRKYSFRGRRVAAKRVPSANRRKRRFTRLTNVASGLYPLADSIVVRA
jgi:hypothetical protein